MPMMRAQLQHKVDLEDQTSPLDQVYLGCTQRAAQVNNRIVMRKQMLFSKLISTNTDVKHEEKSFQYMTAWSNDLKATLKSVLNTTANWRTKRLTNNKMFPHTLFEARRYGNCWSVVRDLLSDCLEMFVIGKNWKEGVAHGGQSRIELVGHNHRYFAPSRWR